MPRKSRFSSPGEYFHVIVRGNNRARIFFSAEDRKHLLSLLEYVVNEYKCKIHAFCLMSNHVHLALQVDEISISKVMHNVSFRYARWVNSRQKRVGHLFQGRYKSISVASKSQLLQLVRYIHFNPVKAKMIKFPENYKWSSHATYLGRKEIAWLTTDIVLKLLDEDLGKSLIKYRELMHFEVVPNIEKLLGYRCEIPFEDFFSYSMSKEVAVFESCDFEKIVKFVCGYFLISQDDLIGHSRKRELSRARGMLVWLARELKVSSLAFCARFLNRDEGGLIRVRDRLQLTEIEFLNSVREGLISQ